MSSAGVPCYNRSKSRVVKRLPTFPIQTRPDQAQRRSSLGIAHNKLLSPDHSAQAAVITARKSISKYRQTKRIESLSDSICVKLGTIQPPRSNPDFESLPDSKSPRLSAAANVRGHRPPAVSKIPARAFTRDRKRAIILEETRRGGNGIAAEGRKGDRAEPPCAA